MIYEHMAKSKVVCVQSKTLYGIVIVAKLKGLPAEVVCCNVHANKAK